MKRTLVGVLVGLALGIGLTVLVDRVGLPWRGGNDGVDPRTAAAAYDPSADFVTHCESFGDIQTTDYGKQPAYVCAVVGTDGYKGPVCFIRRSDGQVLEYARDGTCIPNGHE